MGLAIQRSGRAIAVQAAMAFLLGHAVLAGPVFAQSSSSSGGPAVTPEWQVQEAAEDNGLCKIYAVDTPYEGVQNLRASCRGHILILGLASRFEMFTHPALELTLLDVWRGPERRVLLLRYRDGVAIAEDLTGVLALSAGRGLMSELEGVELDFSDFARLGEIGVRGRPEDTGRGKTGRVRMGEQLALERVRRSANLAVTEE